VDVVSAAWRAVEHQDAINLMFLGLLLAMLGIGGAISLYVIWRSKG